MLTFLTPPDRTLRASTRAVLSATECGGLIYLSYDTKFSCFMYIHLELTSCLSCYYKPQLYDTWLVIMFFFLAPLPACLSFWAEQKFVSVMLALLGSNLLWFSSGKIHSSVSQCQMISLGNIDKSSIIYGLNRLY